MNETDLKSPASCSSDNHSLFFNHKIFRLILFRLARDNHSEVFRDNGVEMLEDLMLMGKDKNEVLTKSSRDLFEVC